MVVSAEAAEPVRAAAARLAEAIAAGVGEASEILGPAPLFRLRGRERRQVVVKTTERAAADPAPSRPPSSPRRATAPLRDVAFSVDVDPQ